MASDICMCLDSECPFNENCLRYTATVYGRQDFFGSSPFSKLTGICTYYIDDRPSETDIKEKAYFMWQEAGCPIGNDVFFWKKAYSFLLAKKRG